MKQIKVRIYPDGKIESWTEGIIGTSCNGYAKIIELLTAMKPVTIEKTDDFYVQQEKVDEVIAEVEIQKGCI